MIETVTVVVLLVNVVTFDGRGFSLRTRVQALIPVLSGPLTYRNVARERRRHNAAPRDT
ncbi:hypothetical protein [Rhodococcus sp. MEB064]|uniref:hypothetical protein n=1 Tax=Rhodococcus sp. MEB064 TaxID=1587522 RepID=UPI000A544338|nr:hypothetical protein [Rhodococcus sp. MEB064]